jgi:hypothetical protein
MAVNRIIYNVQDMFVGPDASDPPTIINNVHLLQRLQRITTVGYDVNVSRVEVKELGRRELVASPIIAHPDIKLSFEYNFATIANELKLGLNPNWSISGNPRYIHNVPLLSGYAHSSRLYDKRNIYLTIAPSGSDSRQVYDKTWTGISGNIYDIIDPNSRNFQVFCFANCAMTAYRFSAAVGDFAKVSTEFVADDMMFFLSGSGVKVPKINTKLRQLIPTETSFAIPKSTKDTQPSVILPGDIQVNIKQVKYVNDFVVLADPPAPDPASAYVISFSTSPGYVYDVEYFDLISGNFWKPLGTVVGDGNEGIVFYIVHGVDNASGNFRVSYSPIEMQNLGTLISNAKITAFDLSLPINREAINFLGHKLPVDRPIEFPVFADLTLNMLVGEGASGDFLSLFNKEPYYDINVILNHPKAASVPSYEKIVARYDIGRAQFVGASFQNGIGDNKTVAFKFRSELVPTSFETGVFVSGAVGFLPTEIASGLAATGGAPTGVIDTSDVMVIRALLTTEANEYLQTEDSFVLAAEDIIFGPTSF